MKPKPNDRLFRVVEQDRDVKVTKREVLWQHETRKLGAPDYDPTRVVEVYGTDESVDRHNTKILVDGWDFNDYRKNPTVLWLHNMDEAVPKMPVGSVIGIAREEYARAEDAKTEKRLAFQIEFPVRGTYAWADLCCDMWNQKHLRAASVGFRNLECRELDPKRDEEEIKKEGFKSGSWAAVLTKNALMELSLVPVGSNPNALAKALREAVPTELRAMLDSEDDAQIDERWIATRLEAVRSALEDAENEQPIMDEIAEDINEVSPVVAEVDDEFEKELDRVLATMEAAPVEPEEDPVLEVLTNMYNETRTQLTQLREEIAKMREEMQTIRSGAATPVAPAATSGEPAPSHLDLLLDENLDNLERMASLTRPR